MANRITLADADSGSKIAVDVEDETLMEEIIESAAAYWEKDPGAYVLRAGDRILRGSTTYSESLLAPGEELELIPDPEGG
ncbi:MAG: hypothetical protein JSW25_02135 [Thermoplasmata archaeon]|nr:MAG: hypothetical protein JSW25_02135 [Thermoplasmata archaeon]